MNKYLHILFLILFLNWGYSQNKNIDSLKYKTEEYSRYHSKDTFKSKTFESNFKNKYNSDDFNYEPKLNTEELSAWDKFKKSIAEFLRDLFSWDEITPKTSTVEIIFKILAYLIILAVIIMIIKIIINKEGGWIFKKDAKKIKTTTYFEEDIHSINFKDIITKEKNNNNLRICVRYYYLWLLKSLSDRCIINWDKEKTNSDYIYEISNPKIKEEFEFLSYIYDYCWYGEFEITSADFEKVEAHFKNALI